jgi:hypothetical protein
MNMKSTLCAVALLAVGAIVSPAHADGHWAKTHPRRDQVNDRLQHQDKRIHEERKEGDLTRSQAAALHKDDHQIRQEERDMASQNGGHLTRQEQRTLNQQENQVSKDIGH